MFPPLNTLPFFGDTAYEKHHFLPFSCIPEVFHAGFHKCVSTYLQSILESHPVVTKIFRKEPRFFSQLYLSTNDSAKNGLFFADYLVNFKSVVQKLSTPNDKHKNELLLGVDGSVDLLSNWPDFWEQQRVINYCILPSVIPEILPKAKFIVVMREPLSMLYSLFWFSCTRFHQPVPSRETQLKGPDIFHDRVVKKIRAIHSCSTEFPLAYCMAESDLTPELYHPLMPECGLTRIYKALYYIHVRKWLSVVPRKRFLFLTLEEVSKNQGQNQIWTFLGTTPMPHVEQVINKQTAIDYKNDPRLAMRNDTREFLKRFFDPYNRMLETRSFCGNQLMYHSQTNRV